MVSLNSRSEYLRLIESDHYSAYFISFLLNEEVKHDVDLNLSNANDVALKVLQSIQTDSKDVFLEAYEQISRRKPKPESEWIYNDILIFSLTVGVCKFQIDKSWLLEALKKRISHSEGENRMVAQTFLDTINENFDSTNNCLPLMLVLKYYLNIHLGKANYINSAYLDLTQKGFPYFNGAFLNLVCVKAFDIILISKGLNDFDKQKATDEFILKFKKRNFQIANALWAFSFIVSISIALWFLKYYLSLTTQEADKINRLLSFFSLIGLGGFLIPVLFLRKKMLKIFDKLICHFYGYKLNQNKGKGRKLKL